MHANVQLSNFESKNLILLTEYIVFNNYPCVVKLLSIYFLVALIVFQSTAKLWVILNFKMKQEYIAKNLCENKAKPEMNCCGNCCLKKELQKQDKSENNSTEIKFKSEEIFLGSILSSNNTHPISFDVHRVNFYEVALQSGYIKRLFRPPSAVSNSEII